VSVWSCRLAAVFVALAIVDSTVVQSQKPVGFTDITRSAGVQFRQINGASPEKHLAETIGSGGLFFDYDGDGWIDIFLVDGGSLADPAVARQARHRLFRNRGDGTFDDVSAAAGPALALSEVSRGAAFGDVDDDGDVDILVVNTNAPARLLRNEVGSRKRWLGVRLLEREPPRDAPGAEAVLEREGAAPLLRLVRIEGSYASASDPRIVFGLGDSSASAGRVRVKWPDGTRETFDDVPAGRYTTLRRGAGKVSP